MNPQTRALMVPLLKSLRKKGFNYFAAETFCEDLSETELRHCCMRSTGFYTQDPLFSEAVATALELGYKLAPYECTDSPPDSMLDDPGARQNFREMGQAKRLKQILVEDSTAKLLVWAGRAHVAKEKVNDWTPMAFCFKEITGVDPFCVYLGSQVELHVAENERPEYKFATWNDLVESPKLFVDGSNYFGTWGYADLFSPRQNFVHGRAEWLSKTTGRVEVEMPKHCLRETGIQCVQVFYKDCMDGAIPIDVVLIRKDEIPPVLMLPPGRKFFFRVTDSEGNEIYAAEITSWGQRD